jgi:hypothetical protein
MAERAVQWVDGVQVSGQDMRLGVAALLAPASPTQARSGVLSGLEVTARSTPDMSVNVAAGQCAVTVTEITPGGTALCANDATVNVPIAISDATNPRIDLIVARVYAETAALADRKWRLEPVTGTPAASPVEPTLPPNSLRLKRVDVPAGATSITASNISGNPARTSAAGGITVSRDATDVAGVTVGQYRDRAGALERWDGTAWVGAGGTTSAAVTAATALSAAAGWAVHASTGVRRVGPLLVLNLFMTNNTGAAITAGSTGNIADTTVATMNAGFRPVIPTPITFRSFTSGVGGGEITTAGNVILAELSAGSSIPAGGTVALQAVLPLA